MQIQRSTRNIIVAAPVVYTLHELEEYLTALPWLGRHRSELPMFLAGAVPESAGFILIAGAIFFVLFMSAALLALKRPGSRWCTAIFGVLILARLENAFLHVGQSIAFRSYTPGLVTAVFVVGPISVIVLRDLVQQRMLNWAALVWMVPAALVAQITAIALLAWPAVMS